MRDDIAGFEFVNDMDLVDKAVTIGRVCRSDVIDGVYGNDAVYKMLDEGCLSPLKHSDIVFKISARGYKLLQEFMLSNIAVLDSARLRFTDVNNRMLVSGNIASWAMVAIALRPYIENKGTYKFEYELLDRLGIAKALGRMKPVTGILGQMSEEADMREFSKEERLVHERQTVHLKVSRDVARMLLKVHNVDITESPAPERVFEPLFFADMKSGDDLPIEIAARTSLRWGEAVQTARESYRRIVEMGVSQEDAMHVMTGSTAMDVFITMSIGQWKYNLAAFTSPGMYYGIQEVMAPILEEMKKRYRFAF